MKNGNEPVSVAYKLLRIDAQRTVEAADSYLQDLCRRHSAGGVLVGLSGGIDSTLVAALAVRSLGKNSVRAVFLHDRFSQKASAINARRVAERIGIEFTTRRIESAMYTPNSRTAWVMRLLHLSGFINRLVYRSYGLIVGETLFVSSLRAGHAENVNFRRPKVQTLVRCAQSGWDERHIHRFRVLGAEAAAKGSLLLSAANRTETMIGWVVKGCAEMLPYRPIIGLYKTQIRQLAQFLNLPGAIRTQMPSPDMMKGITDEFALGMRYGKIDLALDYLEGGLSEEDLRAVGVTPDKLDRVRKMKHLSSWKRSPGMLPAPVDGRIQGGLRI